MKKKSLPLIMLATLAGTFSALRAADAPAVAANSTAAATPAVIKIKPYPLDTCVVTGDKIGTMGKPIVIIQDGQEVKFCCNDCPADFAKDTAKYMKLIDAAAKKAAAATSATKEIPVKPYPLDVCVVENKKLGSMGPPVVVQYNGQEIKFCCKDCLKEFYKDPAVVVTKIADAQKKAQK